MLRKGVKHNIPDKMLRKEVKHNIPDKMLRKKVTHPIKNVKKGGETYNFRGE